MTSQTTTSPIPTQAGRLADASVRAATGQLFQALQRSVLRPGEPGFDVAAPFNVAAASEPVAVVRATSADDVATAVRVAAQHGLDVAVRATGHGAVRTDRPTVLVHTGGLDECRVRPDGTARVGAGVRWRAVMDAAAEHGLAPLVGSAPDVGVVGYTTGGGLSPIGRAFGWASDRVTAFDVVTGDGRVRRATPTEHPDLFWGLRGGKGALGIVTAVEFDLVPLRDLVGGALFFDGADAASVLHGWRRWTATLPEQVGTSLAFLRLPALPHVPPPLAGRLTVAVRYTYVGDHAEGLRLAAPLAELAPVVLGGIGPMPASALGMVHNDPVDPMPVHEAATLLRELPAEAADALLAVAGPDAPSAQVIVELRLMGGALARPAQQPSALCHREAAFSLLTIGIDVPPTATAVRADGDAVLAALASWSDGVGTPNFAPTRDPRRLATRYDRETLERLGRLAVSYDPLGVLPESRAMATAAAG